MPKLGSRRHERHTALHHSLEHLSLPLIHFSYINLSLV